LDGSLRHCIFSFVGSTAAEMTIWAESGGEWFKNTPNKSFYQWKDEDFFLTLHSQGGGAPVHPEATRMHGEAIPSRRLSLPVSFSHLQGVFESYDDRAMIIMQGEFPRSWSHAGFNAGKTKRYGLA
jgi:hypothetical protein